MSIFNCFITFNKVEGDSLASTRNKLVSHSMIDSEDTILDLPSVRTAVKEIHQEAKDLLGIDVTLFKENDKKLLFNKEQFKAIDEFNKVDNNFQLSSEERKIVSEKELINQVLKKELPIEIANSITVLQDVPIDIIGNKNLFLSLKTILNENGVEDEILINWLGINKDKIGRDPRTIHYDKVITSIIENVYEKKKNENNYIGFKTNKLAKESFYKWIKALEKYPIAFQDVMLTHALKWMNNPVRKDKYVLQLSDVALQSAYGIVLNKPYELNRIGKLYDQEVLKTVSDAIGHEPSASGKGYWVHVPRTEKKLSKLDYNTFDRFELGADLYTKIDTYRKNGDKITKEEYEKATNFKKKEIENEESKTPNQFKANVELLRKLSPSTWCTAGGMTEHYVENYDNYLLIVDGVTYVGIEVKPMESLIDELNSLEVISVFGLIGNQQKRYDYLISLTKEELNNFSKRQVKEVTSRNNNGVASIDHLDDTIAFFEKHNLDLNNFTIQNAINQKKLGKKDSDNSNYTEQDNFGQTEEEYWQERRAIDMFNGEIEIEPDWMINDALNREIEEEEAALQEYGNLTTVKEVLDEINKNERWSLSNFYILNEELRNNEELATKAVEYDSHNIVFVSTTMPFYNELLLKAVEKKPDIYTYLAESSQNIKGIKEIYDEYVKRNRINPAIYETIDDELPFSKKENLIQGYYDAKTDKVVIIATNTSTEEASKVAIHEVFHRGFLRATKELGGQKEAYQVLKNAESELMKKLPDLLKRTGHTSLENLMLDYGFDKNSEDGKFKLLQELAARWSESLINKPKPIWWKELLNGIKNWIKKFTGKTLTEKEVDELIGGFVKYGTKNINKKNETFTPINEEYIMYPTDGLYDFTCLI